MYPAVTWHQYQQEFQRCLGKHFDANGNDFSDDEEAEPIGERAKATQGAQSTPSQGHGGNTGQASRAGVQCSTDGAGSVTEESPIPAKAVISGKLTAKERLAAMQQVSHELGRTGADQAILETLAKNVSRCAQILQLADQNSIRYTTPRCGACFTKNGRSTGIRCLQDTAPVGISPFVRRRSLSNCTSRTTSFSAKLSPVEKREDS